MLKCSDGVDQIERLVWKIHVHHVHNTVVDSVMGKPSPDRRHHINTDDLARSTKRNQVANESISAARFQNCLSFKRRQDIEHTCDILLVINKSVQVLSFVNSAFA